MWREGKRVESASTATPLHSVALMKKRRRKTLLLFVVRSTVSPFDRPTVAAKFVNNITIQHKSQQHKVPNVERCIFVWDLIFITPHKAVYCCILSWSRRDSLDIFECKVEPGQSQGRSFAAASSVQCPLSSSAHESRRVRGRGGIHRATGSLNNISVERLKGYRFPITVWEAPDSSNVSPILISP